eukprot:GCRY01006114.1.p1 GENE.GCRY01006114.1~~GCRY01006114.1.p1  ORF type:complete len:411 (-),score=65.24 GCRY01006114.1:206-1438(-)
MINENKLENMATINADLDLSEPLLGSDYSNQKDLKLVELDNKPPLREGILVTIALFSGYASLFALQRELKKHFNITDDDQSMSRIYGIAVSFLYFGNLVFRMGHNVLFAFLAPRARVLMSIFAMNLSMMVLLTVFVFDIKWIGLVFIAYFFGGVGIGTFEGNILNVCTVLGSATKLWALVGIPLGVGLITIFGFLLMGFGLHVQYLYIGVFMLLTVACVIYLLRMFPRSEQAVALSATQFFKNLKAWRQWLPQTWQHSVAFLFNMLGVALMQVIMYMYHNGDVHYHLLFSASVNKNFFFMVNNITFCLGDTSGRRFFYKLPSFNAFSPLILTVLSQVCIFSTFPLLVPIGTFLLALGNGAMYSQACRHIERQVNIFYDLTALSFFLFIGDFGSVIGSNLIPYVNEMVHQN